MTDIAVTLFERDCESCRMFGAEVWYPTGEGAIRLCWLCLHAVRVHGAEPQDAALALVGCTCTAEQIYAPEVLERRRDRAKAAETWSAHRAGIVHRDLKPDNVFVRTLEPTPEQARVAELHDAVEYVPRFCGVCERPTADGKDRCGYHSGQHGRRRKSA